MVKSSLDAASARTSKEAGKAMNTNNSSIAATSVNLIDRLFAIAILRYI
jgi:hypothetical protein